MMSKLFSNFSSFGPSLTSSSHFRSTDSNPNSNKQNSGSYSSSNSTPKNADCQDITRRRLRKISIHLVNEIIKLQKIQHQTHQQPTSTQIKVYCRFKPGATPTFKYDDTMVEEGNSQYSFDGICSEVASQEEVYERIGRGHIEQLLDGNNTTIFAYGQTASGKTHTMFGNLKNPKQYGIIPRSLKHIFEYIKQSQDKHQITCSMLQIYRQKLKDLFASEKCQLKIKQSNDETYVDGLMEIAVENQEQVIDIINFGHGLRKVAQTYHNDYSSRSHTMLFLNHKRTDMFGKIQKSTLCLVDLAGSEKVSKTRATGDTLEEAKKINLSLSCLGNVIHSLTSGSDHIPYRDSKLTRILKNSLCGNYRTSIITTCSLSKQDRAETISTMKFAIRAKKIKNKQHLTKVDLPQYGQNNENSQMNLQEVIKNLQRQLQMTKKQLSKYKKQDEASQQPQPQLDLDTQQVPEEMAQSLPLKSIEFNPKKLRIQYASHLM